MILNSQKCQYKLLPTRNSNRTGIFFFKFSLQPLYHKLHNFKVLQPPTSGMISRRVLKLNQIIINIHDKN